MPNGDIVSGCSDGIVRVFSASEERWASAEKLKEYDDHVASQALPTQQVGDVKKSDLPGPEALNTPGMLALIYFFLRLSVIPVVPNRRQKIR
jgi:phospholipase A-2-activating protein